VHFTAAHPVGGGGSVHGWKLTLHWPASQREVGQLTEPSAHTLQETFSCGQSASEVHWPVAFGRQVLAQVLPSLQAPFASALGVHT